MINLTERAARQVERLQKERAQEGELLRIFVKSGGCSGYEYGMGFSRPAEEDLLQESHGVQYCIDARSLERMDGSEIDFDDGLHGKGFEIRNPQAGSTCGCGRSFS